MTTAANSTSPVQLQIQNTFGVRSKLESCLFFVDEHTVIYPSGNQFVLSNVETKSQRIFRCNELEHIEWVLVHSGAALIAIVATGMNSEKKNSTTISFYDLYTTIGKRKRMFELRDSDMAIVSMAFSHDAKHLAVLECGNREYTLTIWLWQKSRIIATLKLGQADGVSVLSQVAFHPTDHNFLSIIGRRYCRLIRHLDGNLRIQPSSAKFDQYDFISHAWYDSTRFVAGTSNGHICILFNGDIQTEIDAIDGRERTVTAGPRTLSIASSLTRSIARSGLHQFQQEHLDTTRPTGEEVTSICIVSKGFFCIVGGRRLCLYSKIGDSWDFAKAREYVVPINELTTGRSSVSYLSPSQTSFDKQQSNPNQTMWKVAVSSKEEHVLVLSSKQQIYAVSDMTKDQAPELKEAFQLELAFHSYHQSAIRGLDIAVQKPLFVSSGDDHTVRLWNYETNSIEQMKVFPEPIYAISIHPTGHQLVAAFASKVCLMNILIDGFSTIKEFPIHAAHQIQYSNGGHLFAVIDANIIQIISPLYLKVINRLNHGQTVKQIHWQLNDLGLYSLSSNYFVIWNLESKMKTFEYKPAYRLEGGFIVDQEDKYIYLASDDGFIHAVYNGQVTQEIKLPQEDRCSCLQIFPTNGALLCGTVRGSIYVIKTPLSNSSSGIFHYLAHSARVTQIIVAFHESLIISCCEDGALMLWGSQIKRSTKSEDWIPVTLHSKSRFLSLSHRIKQLQVEEEELKLNQEYRLQQMETTYLGDIQRRTEMSENERHHHENLIDKQALEKGKQQRDFDIKLADLKEKFEVEKQRIEEEDRDRMNRELRKEEELIRLSQKMMEDNEFRLKATVEASEAEIRDIIEFFTGKIRETENELAAIKVKSRQALETNEVEKKNIELDIDDEQLKLKLDFENEKKRLIENNIKLQRNFKDTLEQQVHGLTIKLNEQETVAQAHRKRIHDNNMRVQGMTQEISSLSTEITERNQTIREKMDRIHDLELKNQELEKFQYVLEYKIDELTRLINPRTQEIEFMKKQYVEMAGEKEKKETELSRNRFHNTGQQRTLHAIETQVERERQKRKEYDYAIRRIKNDIHAHFADISDPKRVRKAVTHLFDKHIQNENVKSIYINDNANDAVSEEALTQDRQRLFLERTTADLKNKLSNDLHASNANRMRIMKENSLLLQELNNLREEVKVVRGRIQDYEVAKQTLEQGNTHSIDALIQTLNADAGIYNTRQRENDLLKEVQKNQQEILRLRQHLTKLQVGYADNLPNEETNISLIKLA